MVSADIALVALVVHNYIPPLITLGNFVRTRCRTRIRVVQTSAQIIIQTDEHNKIYIIHTYPVYQCTSYGGGKRGGGNPDPVLMYIPIILCFHTCLPQTTAPTELICTPYTDVVHQMYGVCINYRRTLQIRIFTNTEQKCMMLQLFEIGVFAVS